MRRRREKIGREEEKSRLRHRRKEETGMAAGRKQAPRCGSGYSYVWPFYVCSPCLVQRFYLLTLLCLHYSFCSTLCIHTTSSPSTYIRHPHHQLQLHEVNTSSSRQNITMYTGQIHCQPIKGYTDAAPHEKRGHTPQLSLDSETHVYYVQPQ